MRLEIRYGRDGSQPLEIADDELMGVIGPNEVELRDPVEEIDRSLREPVSSPPIEEFLAGGEDVVFIVNDGTRPTPTAAVLSRIAQRYDLSQARFLIATGTHRAPTEEEHRLIFGDLYDELEGRIHSHDSVADEMVHLGSSKNGTPMEVNRMAVEADRLVIITSVEPHYFAGYTGGRKSFLPGVASYATIEANHRLAMSGSAQALTLEGNPVHEDMMDALRAVEGKMIFSVQAVLDRHHRVYRVASGDLHQAFNAATRWADEVFSVAIEERADVVVSVAPYPMDVDLYQSQKALDNGKWALRNGGVLVLVSKCREGIGHGTFLRQLSCSHDPLAVLEGLDGEYRLGYHKAAKMAEVASWARVFAVTDLDDDLVRQAHMLPFATVEEAVRQALGGIPGGRVLVLTDGSMTVPKVMP